MSASRDRWSTLRSAALDEIEQAHRGVGGVGPGRRYATQQINRAYAVLLSSQFQGYCRDLHSECAEHLVQATPTPLQTVLRGLFSKERKLDRSNPNPSNIELDFRSFGVVPFWGAVYALDGRNTNRRRLLEELNLWRNAIAHQDFSNPALAGKTSLTLPQVRRYRSACEGLVVAFDRVMHNHLVSLTGIAPW